MSFNRHIVIASAVSATLSSLVFTGQSTAATDIAVDSPSPTSSFTVDRAAETAAIEPGGRTAVAVWNSGEESASFTASDKSANRSQQPVLRKVEITYALDRNDSIVDRTVRHERRTKTGDLLPLQWAVSSNQVHLNWEPVNGVENWSVSKDGAQIAEISGNAFTTSPGDDIGGTYTIKGQRPVKTDEGTLYEPQIFQTTVPEPDTSTLGKSISDQSVLKAEQNADVVPQAASKAVTSPQASGSPLLEKTRQMSKNAAEGDERYRGIYIHSFIPEARVPSPDICTPLNLWATFGGDNRGFLDYGYQTENWGGHETSRLSASASSMWTEGSDVDINPRMTDHRPYVGESTAYDENLNLVASATAPTSDITLEEAWSDPFTHATYRRIKADSALPLCHSAPAISWEHEYFDSLAGWISVTGEFDQAPSTEILWEAANFTTGFDGSACWFRFNNRGFEYLAPPAPNANIDIDANPEIAVPTCPVQ